MTTTKDLEKERILIEISNFLKFDLDSLFNTLKKDLENRCKKLLKIRYDSIFEEMQILFAIIYKTLSDVNKLRKQSDLNLKNYNRTENDYFLAPLIEDLKKVLSLLNNLQLEINSALSANLESQKLATKVVSDSNAFKLLNINLKALEKNIKELGKL